MPLTASAFFDWGLSGLIVRIGFARLLDVELKAGQGEMVEALRSAVNQDPESPELTIVGPDRLGSAFAVTDLATASIANAAMAARRVAALADGKEPGAILIDRRLACLWFGMTTRPQGWELPDVWDPLAGVYEGNDGFVRLHTNLAAHRRAAIEVLECGPNRSQVVEAVASWDVESLESAVVAAGGVASALRSRAEWVAHEHGSTVPAEKLVHHQSHPVAASTNIEPAPTGDRPLEGVRVLDLTRVLAGPVATRFLAGLGADVLRIDPISWDEAGVAVEVNLGKRCARLDLKSSSDRARFEWLLAEADVVMHGYRRDALDALGYGSEVRRQLSNDVVDVSLNAWGHVGPWRDRRGFDSIVQVASGVAHHGMVAYGTEAPAPLPVQALDHATGYTLAACALHGLADRIEHGQASEWKTSLASHGELLWPTAGDRDLHRTFDGLSEADLGPVELTSWGPVRRARVPVEIDGLSLRWPHGSTNHGTSPPQWRSLAE